jgi:phage-related minor tail protein
MVDVVGLKFVAEGERETLDAMKRYAAVNTDIQKATQQSVMAIERMERQVQTLQAGLASGRVAQDNYAASLREIKRQYAALTGGSIQKASAEIERFARASREAASARLDESAREGFERVAASVDRVFAATQRYEQQLAAVRAAEDRTQATAAEAARIRERLAQQYQKEIDRITGVSAAKEKEARAEQNATRAREQAAQAFQRFNAQIDPAVAAQQRFANAQNVVNNAVRTGAITKAEGVRAMAAYRASLSAAEQAVLRAGSASSILRNQFLATANTIAILDGPLGGIASRFSAFGVLLGRTGLLLGVVAVGFTALGAAIGRSIRTGMDAETSMLSLEAAVRSTGGAAGVTARQIEGMARSIEASTLASRDGVRQAAVQLLTFESITGEIFERTLRVSQDIAQTFNRDIGAVAVQVAKALDNPTQSLASLERAYGALRPGIRQTVIALLEQGDVVRAQSILMEELERRFGGLGTAAAGGLAGAFDTLRASLTDFRERLFSVVDGESRVTNAVNSIARAVNILAENLNRFVAVGQAAVLALLARYVAGIRLAALATAVMTANVVALTAAFTRLAARTGVGLFIIGLGELIYQFGYARDGSNRLRETLEQLRDSSQAGVASANTLAAEISRLGTVSRESAEDMLALARARQMDLRGRIDATRAAVLLSERFNDLLEQEQRIQARLSGGQLRRGERERLQERLANLRQLQEAMFQSAIPPEVQEAYDRIVEQVINLELALRRSAEATVEVGAGIREASAEFTRAEQQLRDSNTLRERELHLIRAGVSEQRARVIAEREQEEVRRQALEAEARAILRNTEATQEARRLARIMLEAVAEARELDAAMQGVARAADMRRPLQNTLDGLLEQNEVLETQIRLLDSGVDFLVAQRLAEIEVQKARVQTRIVTQGVTDELLTQLALLAIISAETGRNIDLQNTVAGSRPSASGGGGGGREAVRLADLQNELLKEQTIRAELLRLSGEQLQVRETYYDLVRRLGDSEANYTEAQIMAVARLIAAETERNDVLQERQQLVEDLAKSIESQMERAFMSMVDGTKSAKDAFRDMARSILAELYRVLVVQRLVGMVSGPIQAFSQAVIPSANGNAFQGGNVVPFANGGVVSRPTLFPMMGGRTGLMGEAGPEAIMPLKRGRDGKLGVQAESGNTVHIVQNFSVAANGDESVKRIVAQQVPAIAEATKAAVIDARQRGGKMRAAFR